MRHAAAAAAMVLLAACGGGGGDRGGRPPPGDHPYATVEELRDALGARGLPCATDRVHHDIVPGVDTMTCDGTEPAAVRYLLVVWHRDSPADLDAVTAAFERVEGDRWSVAVLEAEDEAAETGRVRAALGGRIVPPDS